ncbi:DNA polymerase epsilon subunit 2 [Entophlyctis luteolus]|nr:DNA polymerase epsilon subunit 2 [Entophlyctis luteolus]
MAALPPILWRRTVQILSKKYGLTLRADAAALLKDLLAESSDVATNERRLMDVVDDIAQSYIHRQGAVAGSAGQIVEAKVLREVLAKLTLNDADTLGSAPDDIRAMQMFLHVVDLFKVPKWEYCVEARAFVRSSEPLQLHATAAIQSHVLRDRYELIKQRVMRNENFRPPTFAAARNTDFYEITPIKNLTGSAPGAYLLFGMLTRMAEGKHHLEDTTSFIELEFAGEVVVCSSFVFLKVMKTVGMFTHGCFVLVEGEYTNRQTFRATMMGMPPVETRAQTIATFGRNADIFGAPREATSNAKTLLREREAVNVSFVVLSDIWLDDAKVLAKLRFLFEGYMNHGVIPLAFIFIGNFTSKPYIYNSSNYENYKELFKALADLIHDFPEINRTSQFVFVPGPTDPWGGKTIPRPPLPDVFLARIRAKVQNAVFTSNPARIKYCTQEIVVFREDLVSKMRRNCIVPPDEHQESGLKVHVRIYLLAKTLIAQSHLCPLPVDVQPRYAAFDHTLRLYPLPHLLVLADKYDAYDYHDKPGDGADADSGFTQCINPGSFGNHGTFMTYTPCDQEVQMCTV